MSITISADDLRTIRALEIAASADQWLSCRTDAGEPAYRVPSQGDLDRAYLVTPEHCDCPDFQRSTLSVALVGEADAPRACKHMLAVRLYRELVRAQRHLDRPARRRQRSA
ncbi:MAG: hypothetical protein LC797_07730 [Chloroflexi bacterium]|nr:hypothetical protein [Chloroflexota bacterium]